MTDRPPAERAELEVAATRELGRLREEFARHREAWGVKRAELAGHVTELLTDQKGLRSKVATLTAERDALREEVAVGRKAMGILAFELERMKAERDAARKEVEAWQLDAYKVDFEISLISDPTPWGSPAVASVVVELDGHDFHEKTKKQAAHDKKRDRFFVSRGVAVLRFTGSEVHKDAPACAKEAVDLLTKSMGALWRARAP